MIRRRVLGYTGAARRAQFMRGVRGHKQCIYVFAGLRHGVCLCGRLGLASGEKRRKGHD